MAYSKKFQSKKVLVANVTKIVEAAYYNELNTEKEGIEVLYFDDIVEGIKFTYANTNGQIVSTTFRKASNMDSTYNEEWDEQNDDQTFSYSVVNQANQNLCDYAIVAVAKSMLKRYAKQNPNRGAASEQLQKQKTFTNKKNKIYHDNF